jgi:hypothetical protein
MGQCAEPGISRAGSFALIVAVVNRIRERDVNVQTESKPDDRI